MLRDGDLHLPTKGWGRIVLAAPASRPGTAWTDHGTARRERGLKHRAAHETRNVPVLPDLVKLLRAPSAGTARPRTAHFPDRGAASSRTRPTAPCGPRSARRPSPLPSTGRHSAAAPTTCGGDLLNSGVPATEVARRAGHGVAVLLKIYAYCIDGQAMPRTSGSPTLSELRTPSKTLVTRETATASRHPELPVQRQEARRTASVTARTGPVRGLVHPRPWT
jgi:hypothetical protein